MGWTRRMTVAAVTVAGLAMAIPAVPASADPTQAGGTYLDDNGSVHEGMIEALTTAGVIRGCNTAETIVCPGVALSRGQMASLLTRAFALPAATSDQFAEDGGVHEDSINRVAEAGIAQGRADGTFGAGEFVNREQLATFLRRALELPEQPTGPFTDVAGVHAGSVNAVAMEGITAGCNVAGTLYCPGREVTREQAASFLGRALDLTATVPPALTNDSSIDDWCAVADRFVATLSPADAQELIDYEFWVVGLQRPGRFTGGSLPLQLGTISPFTGDPVAASWIRSEGLLRDLADEADMTWTYPVFIERVGDEWDCGATADLEPAQAQAFSRS